MANNPSDVFFQKEPSGEFRESLKLPEKCRLKKAILRITGTEYRGQLNSDSPGVSVSPVGSGQTFKQYVVDFHIFRSVCSVNRSFNWNPEIATVQQWGGIKFLDDNVKGLPLVKTEKILVTLSGLISLNDFKQFYSFSIGSYPSNLTLSLGDESPFWSYPGELTREVTVPDFSEKLGRYLGECKPDSKGDCNVPLTFRSDSPGGLEIGKEDIDFDVVWSEAETRKVNFEGTEPKTEALEIKDIKKVSVSNISFDYKGSLSGEFIDDQLSAIKEQTSIKVTTGTSIGLKLQPSAALKATVLICIY